MQVCYSSSAEVFGVCFSSFPGLEAALANRRILSLVSGKGFSSCFLCAFSRLSLQLERSEHIAVQCKRRSSGNHLTPGARGFIKPSHSAET